MTSNTNLIYNYAIKQGSQIPALKGNVDSSCVAIDSQVSKDTVSFGGSLSENLKYSKEKSYNSPIFEGTVNDNNASIKIDDVDKITYMEGQIGDKKLLLQADNNDNNLVYTGKYNDKDFELHVDYNRPSKASKFWNETILGKKLTPDYFNISGKIGDRNIEINLPNAQVPKDDDEKDLLSVILFDNLLTAKTYNNKIVGVGFSNIGRKCMEYHQEKRDKLISEDIKPMIIQGISALGGIAIGAFMTKIKK